MHLSAARPRSRVLMETLEPRILYSADLAAVVGNVGADAGLAQELRLQTLSTAAVPSATGAEIAFVDLGVPDASTLVSGLLAQRAQGRLIEIVTFTAEDDGLALISQTLAERQADGARFDAVHLFSHGRAGAVQLGTASLDADSLLMRAGEIAGWGSALGEQADLMLYGCDVADGASGLFLLEGLAALTGADVAASDDPTGSAALGGNWLLEQHTGRIEAEVALDLTAQAAWSGLLGNEIQVNTTTTSTQTTDAETRGSQQAVAMDADGNFVAVWTSAGQDGQGKGVYVRRFAFDGTALTGEIQVNTTTANDQQNARIVGDSAGNFAVVWSSSNQDGTPSSVYFRRFAADGTALTGEIRANATATGSQSNAVIGMNATSGAVVVAWEGAGPSTGSVYFRRFAADGTALDATDRAVSATGGEANATVAMDATGRFVVAWGRSNHIYFQRYDAAGVAAGSVSQADNGLSNSIGATVAMDASGNFALAYREQTTLPGIWGRAFTVDGTARSFWFNADTGDGTASGDSTTPSISLAADGSAVVVYQRSGDGDGVGVYARRLSAAGTVQGTTLLVNQTATGSQASASVAVHDTSRFVVVWSGQSAGDSQGVVARTFAPANAAPLISTNGGTSSAVVSVAENTTAVTTVGASDLDWPIQTVSYAIVGGADQAKFSIDSQSGVLRFVAAQNFETPTDADADNVYDVTVQASDGLLGSTQALAVTIADANEFALSPVTDTDGAAEAVDEDAVIGTRVGLTALATDADGSNNTVVYGLDDSAGGRFAIDSTSGVVTVAALLDAETATTHSLTVRATSSDGSSQTQTYVLSVRDVDEFDVSTPVDTDATADTVLESATVGSAVGLTVSATDADLGNHTVTYNLADDAGGRFTIGTSSGVVTVARALDAETALSHTVVVQARSTDGSVSSQSFTIAVQDVNESSIGAIADLDGAAETVREDATIGTAVGLQARAIDADATNSTVTYALTDDAGGRFAIDAATGVVTVAAALDAETAQSHTVVVQARSTDGSVSSHSFTVAVQDVNESTIGAIADLDGAADTVREDATIGAAVGFQARAIDADATNSTVTYALTDDAGGRFAIDTATGVVTVAAALDAETTQSHTVVVQARSTDGSVSSQSFTVAVQDVDEFDVSTPIDADAVANLVQATDGLGTAVGITASASDLDVSLNQITYTLADDAAGRFAIDASSGLVTLARSVAADIDTTQSLVVQATSADGSVATRTFSVAILGTNLFAPVIGSNGGGAAAALTVPENTTALTTVVATDADVLPGPLTYTLVGGADQALFTIDAASGVLRFVAPPDAETPRDAGADNVHEVVVQVSDGVYTDTQTLTITVTDVNEAAISVLADTDPAADAVPENAVTGTAVGVRMFATDADATNNTVTYSLDDSAGGRFAIDAGTGVLTVAGLLDAEVALAHTVVVRAVSDDGSATTLALTLAVQDVNEYGLTAITDADAGPDRVREDDPIGTVVGVTAWAQDSDATNSDVSYSLTDDAGGRFAIGATTGVVTLARGLDAETAQVHSVTVRALSSDGSAQFLTFTVAVTDVDEFDLSAITDTDAAPEVLAENVAIGTRVGITARAVDADVTNNTVTYALLDSAGGRFAIHATTGVITVAAALDAETAQSHTLVVRATSSDRSLWTQSFTVAVTDVDEFDLVAVNDADATADAVSEHAAIGTAVGLRAQAVDADVTNNTVTYALTDSAGGRFAIDARSGVVTVAGPLDAETAQSHTVVVRATSSDGSAWAQAFTVAVTDVDEFDLVAVDDTDTTPDAVLENAAIGTTVGVRARAVDADATNNTVTYALTDSAGGRFAIDASTGVITVAAALDTETAPGHTLVVQATSSDGSRWTQAFSVAVTDVDEFDLVAVSDADSAPDAVSEHAVVGTSAGLRVQAVDADATNNTVTYALTDSAGGRFAVDASTGAITVAAALDAETALSHTLVVRATSADGSAWTQAYTVAVADVDEFDLAVVADADARADAVLETAVAGTAVGVQGRAVDGDATANTVTYTLDDTAGGRFAVDATTGAVTLARSVQEEGFATRSLVLRATSSDGSTVTASFTIAITAVNDAAPVITSDGGGATATLAVAEGQSAVTQVLASDADLPAETLRYTIAGGADAAMFTLDPVSGLLRFAAAPDAEAPLDQGADNVYEATVQASDGLRTDVQALRIAVQPLNDTAPVITSDGGGTTAVRHVAENTLDVTQVQARDADLPADTLAYAVTGGADAALFTVDTTTGVLRWRAAPDRETPRDAGADGSYDVTVSASDGLHSVSQSLAVVVDNVDEAPLPGTSTLTISEGGTARPVLVAADVDTPASGLVYTVQDWTGGRFELVAAPGVAVTRFTQADADAGAVRFVADGGEAAPVVRLVLADDHTALAAQAATVVFTPVNDVPVVAAVHLDTVDEDSTRLITVAELLAGASDAEGDALTVSELHLTGGEGTLTDLGGGRWRFDPAADWSGAVTLAGQVSDGQAAAALAVSLPVRALNDAPRIVSGGGEAVLALDVAENTGGVTTVAGADIDTLAPLRYAVVGGADAALFQIDAATGALSFRQAPDREQPTDANRDNRYDVTVEVSDGALTAQQALQITVTDVNEAPVVTRNVLLVTDGAVTLVLQASDPDTPTTALTYRVDTVEGGQFERATAPGTAVRMFTQAELDAAQVVWVAPAGSTAALYALRLSDGLSEVRVGSPALERYGATTTPTALTLTALAAGEASAATSAGDSTANNPATVAASPRRSDPALTQAPAAAESAGDAGLGLGQSQDAAHSAGGTTASGGRAGDVAAAVSRTAAERVGPAEPAEQVERALDLPSESAEAPRRLVTELDLWGARSGTSLAEQLDQLRQQVAEAQQAGMVSLASTALVSTGLSVGYVIWLVRGGVLMTSLMSVVPAWAGMDPLPVLAEMRRAQGGLAGSDGAEDDDYGGDDPIEKLFSKARRLLVRPTGGLPNAPELPETHA
ncbi:cadherin domain-containing protein [Sphaerotilus sp.]|uniref:cadherin domain-containing protein n=1 Tax=Sphaerotilus sp. TaxID=2093942 RepID=UPI00286E3C5D|nr:cadherin domain-containing protein [Sphaerotilus sp.]